MPAMNLFSSLRNCFVGTMPAIGIGSFAAASFALAPAYAGAELKGCIKWWHGGEQKWLPLKDTEVEVEWDGAGSDKMRWTNDEGCYKAKVRNAYVGDGHNMNVQVYAKRRFPGKSQQLYVRAFETMLDAYPTYFEAPAIHVGDNKSRVSDVNIKAGTQYYASGVLRGNLVQASNNYYHWNIAAADILGRYYDWAHGQGFRQLRSVDIIAPALAPGNSYFNLLTNNINLVPETNPNNSSYGGYPGWTFTILHEGTHALHAHISPSTIAATAPGLFQPTKHDVYTITNPMVGWTEGFASFLPVAYLTSRGALGQYANKSGLTGIENTKKVGKVASNSFIENHLVRSGQANVAGTLWGKTSWFNDSNSQGRGGSEGYVVGFLWDLFDSHKNTEVHPSQVRIRTDATNWNHGLARDSAEAYQICQVEYTLPRPVRNLPNNNKMFADSQFGFSSDCLSGIEPIANVLSVGMKADVSDFGSAYINGKSDAVQYEVLKAYMNNGMSGAVPRSLQQYKDWTAAQQGTTIDAYPDSKGGQPNASNMESYGAVDILVPVTTGPMLRSQWLSATCQIANSTNRTKCTPVFGSGQAKSIQVSGLIRSQYCSRSAPSTVGVSESSPTFVVLDDGVSPFAFRLNSLCSTRLKPQKAPF